MKYIENNLLNNEKIIYATHPHWIVFSSTTTCLFFAVLVYGFGKDNSAMHTAIYGWPLYEIFSIFLVLYAMYLGLYATIRFLTSEYGVTDKRVIMKVGWIQRDAFETFLTRTEGIKVWQSVLGRIFNYGTITVVGTGGTADSFREVPNPLQFRHIIQEQLERELKEFQTENRRN